MSEPPLILPVRLEFVPKTYDIDFAGHVSNISYIRWLEDLRLHWLDTHFPLERQMQQGLAPTLLRTEIDYLHQIRLFDRPVLGTMGVAEQGRLKWVLAARFEHGDRVMARARQTGVWFRLEDARPVRAPDELKGRIDEAQGGEA